MSEVREQSNKEGRLWFLGVDAEEYTGELPEARSRLCVCRTSFLMTFVTSGMSLAGSRKSVTFQWARRAPLILCAHKPRVRLLPHCPTQHSYLVRDFTFLGLQVHGPMTPKYLTKRMRESKPFPHISHHWKVSLSWRIPETHRQ